VVLDPAPRPAWRPSEPLTAEACRAAFDAVEPYTIGLEEELMVVAPDTLELSNAGASLVALADDERIRPELRASQVELVTPVCHTAVEACAHLAELRHRVAEVAAGSALLAAAGTHPFSAGAGGIAAGERNELLVEEYEWAAFEAFACGLHVHVAVGDADRALAVYNAVRSYVPELAALAANSPFLRGRDTGFASVRPKVNEAFPREGIPPAFASWEEYAELVSWGRHAFPDATFLWWEVRPHPGFGTLELRAADAQTRVEDAAAIAAVAQALVVSLGRRHDAGERLPAVASFRIAENFWSAVRHGLGGWMLDLETGEQEPTLGRVDRLLTELEPTAAELGCEDELVQARTLLGGNGADRQRYVAEREGLEGLIRWLVGETLPG
jgi:carboxylate-amine ligase